MFNFASLQTVSRHVATVPGNRGDNSLPSRSVGDVPAL